MVNHKRVGLQAFKKRRVRLVLEFKPYAPITQEKTFIGSSSLIFNYFLIHHANKVYMRELVFRKKTRHSATSFKHPFFRYPSMTHRYIVSFDHIEILPSSTLVFSEGAKQLSSINSLDSDEFGHFYSCSILKSCIEREEAVVEILVDGRSVREAAVQISFQKLIAVHYFAETQSPQLDKMRIDLKHFMKIRVFKLYESF